MVIAIDIGNTNITFGVFNNGSDLPVHNANIQTDRKMTTDELAMKYGNLLEFWKMDSGGAADVLICSVVPGLNYEFAHMFEKYHGRGPRFIGGADIPIQVHYDFPDEIGADRIVNAYAGSVLFPGENLVIVDFGTATTFDIISSGGAYEGGLIMTGIMTSLQALEERASKLPHIDLAPTSRLVGKNTVEGIRSGIINGNGAMVDELVRRISAEMGWAKCRVIATGGLSKLIKGSSRLIGVIDQHLTLRGIYHIWKLKNG